MIWLHYIYVHKGNDGDVYYVGKGANQDGLIYFNRAHSRNYRSSLWRETVKRRGKIVEIICSCKDEIEAEAMEKHFIKFYGRRDHGGILINQTDGGKGLPGWIPSAETRKKFSAAFAGRKLGPHTPEHREKIGAAQRGRKKKPLTSEHKAKISKFFTGRKRCFSEEHKQKLAIAGVNREVSFETRSKMSLAHDRRPRFTGKHSEETKAKMRAGQRAYQERRRKKS